jgi:hypothetical protein
MKETLISIAIILTVYNFISALKWCVHKYKKHKAKKIFEHWAALTLMKNNNNETKNISRK